MRICTGWYDNQYFVVKPLNNGHRQELVMIAISGNFGRWYIAAGVFSSSATYNSIIQSAAWEAPMSTNKKPSIKTIPLALEALHEIEQEISKKSNGKKRFIYIDGLDERRLRVYAKVLDRNNCGYKKSTRKSEHSNLPMLYKKL